MPFVLVWISGWHNLPIMLALGAGVAQLMRGVDARCAEFTAHPPYFTVALKVLADPQLATVVQKMLSDQALHCAALAVLRRCVLAHGVRWDELRGAVDKDPALRDAVRAVIRAVADIATPIASSTSAPAPIAASAAPVPVAAVPAVPPADSSGEAPLALAAPASDTKQNGQLTLEGLVDRFEGTFDKLLRRAAMVSGPRRVAIAAAPWRSLKARRGARGLVRPDPQIQPPVTIRWPPKSRPIAPFARLPMSSTWAGATPEAFVIYELRAHSHTAHEPPRAKAEVSFVVPPRVRAPPAVGVPAGRAAFSAADGSQVRPLHPERSNQSDEPRRTRAPPAVPPRADTSVSGPHARPRSAR
ncbi:hypothetical protein [Polyangium aurulentum]|uniref:hypothetical protein n=1 Tax=Polyangium aurulentum TaxID=2567896 RepID=UPI001469DB94|nr:hypothetical protein [Polyangium aurulentum]UQA60393.1 hypothetical protein E8A73_007940 [Polyangium aurulentum]